MKLCGALAFTAALAASAVAQPVARRDVSVHTGAHYKTTYDNAHKKYEDYKKASGEALAASSKWLAIANANKEAYDAYGTKEQHKANWDNHVKARPEEYKKFLIPKEKEKTDADKTYNDKQTEYDGELEELKSTHTKTTTPIKTAIASEEEKITNANNEITRLGNAKTDQETNKKGFQETLTSEQDKLKAEITKYDKAKKVITDKKEALLKAHNTWNTEHKDKWDPLIASWKTARDKAAAALKSTHDTAHSTWLGEKLGADVSNGHCPCINGGECSSDEQDDVESYTCVCPSPWEGQDCEEHEG